MFKHTKAFSSFSVDNLSEAKKFYGDLLQLEISDNKEPNVLNLHIKDGTPVIIYEKPGHEPASFTVLNFPVPDIEQAVASLNKLGIKFEQYEGAIKTDEKGIMRGNGPTIAWFKDPAGNILSIIEQQ